MVQSMNAFVREVDRYAEACLLDKPLLNLIDCLRVIAERVNEGVGSPIAGTYAVELLVYVRYAVFPHFALPPWGGQRVLQHTSEAVQCCQLARLFVAGHPAEQVGDTRIDRLRGVFVNI